VAVAILVTVSVSGYFMGLRQTASTISLSRAAEVVPLGDPEENEIAAYGIPNAVDYAYLPYSNHRQNVCCNNSLDTLTSPRPDPAFRATDEERAEARAARMAHRAFEGAPPTIPHPIEQVSSASCLACHEHGAVIKDRVATKISHPHWSNCIQCHAPSSSSPGDSSLKRALAGNEFKGMREIGRGTRAYPGAPPQIPHTTWKREDCASCHGPKGHVSLRTTHYNRQNCQQCHAPSAAKDQREFALPDLFQGRGEPGGGE
jgi:nitrate reductase (cytochrome), electron transfer subunit